MDLNTPFEGLGPQLTGRWAKKLLAAGVRSPARITGIEVSHTAASDGAGGSNDYDFAFALEVRGPAGAFRAGVRQRLHPERWRAHLGAEVVVAHDGDAAVIDWQQTLRGMGAEPGGETDSALCKSVGPPADGVTDRFAEGLRGGVATQAVLVRVVEARALGLPLATPHLDVEITTPDGGTVQRRLERVRIPVYALHAVEPGVVLPVLADPGKDRVVVDWLGFVNGPRRHAPVPAWDAPEDEPARHALDPQTKVEALVGRLGIVTPTTVGAPMDPTETIEGISFDAWVAIKGAMQASGVGRRQRDAWAAGRGVPLGRWKEVDKAWNARLKRDPALAVRYVDAYADAVRRAL